VKYLSDYELVKKRAVLQESSGPCMPFPRVVYSRQVATGCNTISSLGTPVGRHHAFCILLKPVFTSITSENNGLAHDALSHTFSCFTAGTSLPGCVCRPFLRVFMCFFLYPYPSAFSSFAFVVFT
jgi:hypothetical protein